MAKIERIAVLTSGGDAPGMNAAIRAVTRTSLHRGWSVFGVERGFRGLLDGAMRPLDSRAVSGIMQTAGTVLGASRPPEFIDETVRAKAVEWLRRERIDGLVVIGGSGTQRGAAALHEMGFPVVGIAATIDNDVYGAEIALGVDTALNVAVEAMDRLRATASSHRCVSVVEVMGREHGYLALMAGVAGGAEAIMAPGMDVRPEEVVEHVRAAHARGKKHALVVVAEGAVLDGPGMAAALRSQAADMGFELRTTVLGHVQRGGTPSVFDRLLGTRTGAAATACVASGQTGVMVGLIRGEIRATQFGTVADFVPSLEREMTELAEVLSV